MAVRLPPDGRSASRSQMDTSNSVMMAMSHAMTGVPAIGTSPVTPANHASPSSARITTLCAAAAKREPASLRSA